MGNTIYSDLNKNYGVLGTISPLSEDEDAINDSIDNILTTIPGERLFNPHFGANVMNRVFDPINNHTSFAMMTDMIVAINQWEPRIRLLMDQSTIRAIPDENRYEITLRYEVILSRQVGDYRRYLDSAGRLLKEF